MTHEAICAHAIVQIAHDPRVLGYLAGWYRMYRKSGPCGPKVRLRINQKNRTAGSLSLSNRETSMSLLHRRISARACSFARRLRTPFVTPNVDAQPRGPARPPEPKLDGLSVHIFSMSNFKNCNLTVPVIYEINDSVLTLPYPIAVGVSRKLLGTLGARIGAQGLNSLYDSLTIGFCS